MREEGERELFAAATKYMTRAHNAELFIANLGLWIVYRSWVVADTREEQERLEERAVLAIKPIGEVHELPAV